MIRTITPFTAKATYFQPAGDQQEKAQEGHDYQKNIPGEQIQSIHQVWGHRSLLKSFTNEVRHFKWNFK